MTGKQKPIPIELDPEMVKKVQGAMVRAGV